MLLKTLVRMHTLLATFFLPMGVMFMLTGALYTLEIKGEYSTTTHEIALNAPLEPDLDKLNALATGFLAQHALAPPTGTMKVRKTGTSFEFEWTGTNRDVILSPTDNPLVAKAQVKDTTWYRRLVQLHKAKGGAPFKALAVAGAVGLLALFATGCAMAFQRADLRKQALLSLAAGIAAFCLMAFLS